MPSPPKSAALLLLFLSACRGNQEAPADPQHTDGSGDPAIVEVLEQVGPTELATEPNTVSEATESDTAQVEAVTPIAWASELSPGAFNALVDVSALREWATSIPSVTDADERITNLLAEAVSEQVKRTLDLPGTPVVVIEPGATVLAVSIAANGFSVVSDQPMAAPDGRSSSQSGRYRLTFGADLPTGGVTPADLPRDAFVAAWAPDFANLPSGLRGSLDFLDAAGVSGFAVGIRPDGSLRASLSTDDPAAVGLAFGRGQAFASQAAGQLNQAARPEYQPFVTYLNRSVQSLFAILAIEEEEGLARLVVDAPRCGGAFRNLLAVATLVTLTDAAAADDRTAPREFVPMTGHFSESCHSAVSGPLAALPERLLAVGSPDAGEQSFIIAVDLAGALREGLPSGFGLFPFALDPEMLTSVFSGRPLGMNGLEDVDAHWVFASERTAGSDSVVHRSVLFPSGMRSFLPPDSAIDTMRPVPMVEHVAFASPAIDLRERIGGEVAPHWLGGHARLPAGAYAAAFLGAGLVQPWGDRLGHDDPARAWLHSADGALVWLAPRSGIAGGVGTVGVSLYGVSDPPSAEEIREILPSLLAQISHNDRAPERAAERESTVRLALQQLTISTTDSSIDLRLDGEVSLVVAALIRIGLPMIGSATTRTVGLPQGFQLPR